MFYFENFYGKKILKSSLLQDKDCFFTTREFVLTPSNRTDLADECEKNRSFLKEKLHSNYITTAKQVHGDNIEIIESNKTFYDNTDAMISNIPNTLLLMNFADCVPIILYDKESKSGAIAHAGWRGTAAKIAYKTVQKMQKELNIKPDSIIALIGPSIGKCCFETGEEVFEQLIEDKQNKELYEEKNEKYFIDLKKINYNQLKEAGVEKIDTCTYCTCCMSDIFFSYRKEKGITARHSAVIKI
ncbi:peptidoglycan editing factor PgeF [bacterium]|nr:peptidoglycan editing factor PgeF [bacterium]